VWGAGATRNGLRERGYPIPSRHCQQAKDCDEKALQIGAREAVTSDAGFDVALGQLVASVLGIFGVGYTVFYARLAWKEAQHGVTIARQSAKGSEDAARYARDSSEQDLRAWLDVSASLEDYILKDERVFISVATTIKNIGKTPAFRVWLSHALYCHNGITVGEGQPATLDKFPSRITPLLPGAVFDQRYGLRIERRDLDAAIALTMKASGVPMLSLDIVVYYHVVGDGESAPRRLTSVRYHLVAKWEDAQGVHIDRRRWLSMGGPTGMESVKFARANSAPLHMT
jgi:hypothetical protein